MKNKIIILTGPTASGKTKLSIEVAKKFNCEIINCDSTQFYKDISIGVDKILNSQTNNIKHHLISFLNLNSSYSIYDFYLECMKLFIKIWNKNKIPLIVGSSGLYIDTLINNYTFTKKRSDKFFKKYENLSNDNLHKILKSIDPIEANKIHMNNRIRVLRAIEIYFETNKTKTELVNTKIKKNIKYSNLLLVIDNDDKILKQKN